MEISSFSLQVSRPSTTAPERDVLGGTGHISISILSGQVSGRFSSLILSLFHDASMQQEV